jgi:hypothetical protein
MFLVVFLLLWMFDLYLLFLFVQTDCGKLTKVVYFKSRQRRYRIVITAFAADIAVGILLFSLLLLLSTSVSNVIPFRLFLTPGIIMLNII